ncbi:unnamed protein product [Closterium sp. Yama58-4]|nr:unnamed protein product [Closterium sp. Yama58-4]
MLQPSRAVTSIPPASADSPQPTSSARVSFPRVPSILLAQRGKQRCRTSLVAHATASSSAAFADNDSGDASGSIYGDDSKPENPVEASGLGSSDVRLEARRAIDFSERLMADPYLPVESAMTTPVVTTTPANTISSILDQFVHFTGLPVVDREGHCVGVISNIDIAKHQRRSFKSVADALVKEVMTSPAIVITEHAPVAYAAGLMLKHKIHRLPVVDNTNVVVGILTRTDIYEPLMPAVNPVLHRLVGFEDPKPPTANLRSSNSVPSMAIAPASTLLAILALIALASSEFLPARAIENKCSACVAISKELLLILSEERPRNHLDMRNRLNSEGKREGKLIDYRVSELRAVEILDGLCKKMDKYSVVTKDERRVWSSHRDYSRSANTDRKKLIREEQGKEIKRWCDRLLEEYEDDITAQLRAGDLNMDADVPALLCARITRSCKPKALEREVLAADDGSSPSSGVSATVSPGTGGGLVDVTEEESTSGAGGDAAADKAAPEPTAAVDEL